MSPAKKKHRRRHGGRRPGAGRPAGPPTTRASVAIPQATAVALAEHFGSLPTALRQLADEWWQAERQAELDAAHWTLQQPSGRPL